MCWARILKGSASRFLCRVKECHRIATGHVTSLGSSLSTVMVCCLLCFSGAPVEGDERSMRNNKFQISLMEAIWKGQPCCLISCCCPCCAACHARKEALDNDMSKYICCQGYFPGCCCCRPGQVGESSCPDLCLCLEAFCCVGPSISTTRLYMMDKHNLANDDCDNRLIRLNNCREC